MRKKSKNGQQSGKNKIRNKHKQTHIFNHLDADQLEEKILHQKRNEKHV